jgi:hypothetical protein
VASTARTAIHHVERALDEPEISQARFVPNAAPRPAGWGQLRGRSGTPDRLSPLGETQFTVGFALP